MKFGQIKICDSTLMVTEYLIPLFFCVSGSFLFPITSHVITSKSKSQKFPIERTRIEYLAWLFFGTLKVGQDRDDS